MLGDRRPDGIGPPCFGTRIGLDIIYNLDDCLENILDLANALDGAQLLLLLVVIDDRQGMRFVNPQAVTDGFFIVIGAMAQLAATRVTAPVHVWRGIKHVIHLAAGQAGAPSNQSLNQCVDIYRHEQREVERLTETGQ